MNYQSNPDRLQNIAKKSLALSQFSDQPLISPKSLDVRKLNRQKVLSQYSYKQRDSLQMFQQQLNTAFKGRGLKKVHSSKTQKNNPNPTNNKKIYTQNIYQPDPKSQRQSIQIKKEVNQLKNMLGSQYQLKSMQDRLQKILVQLQQQKNKQRQQKINNQTPPLNFIPVQNTQPFIMPQPQIIYQQPPISPPPPPPPPPPPQPYFIPNYPYQHFQPQLPPLHYPPYPPYNLDYPKRKSHRKRHRKNQRSDESSSVSSSQSSQQQKIQKKPKKAKKQKQQYQQNQQNQPKQSKQQKRQKRQKQQKQQKKNPHTSHLASKNNFLKKKNLKRKFRINIFVVIFIYFLKKQSKRLSNLRKNKLKKYLIDNFEQQMYHLKDWLVQAQKQALPIILQKKKLNFLFFNQKSQKIKQQKAKFVMTVVHFGICKLLQDTTKQKISLFSQFIFQSCRRKSFAVNYFWTVDEISQISLSQQYGFFRIDQSQQKYLIGVLVFMKPSKFDQRNFPKKQQPITTNMKLLSSVYYHIIKRVINQYRDTPRDPSLYPRGNILQIPKQNTPQCNRQPLIYQNSYYQKNQYISGMFTQNQIKLLINYQSWNICINKIKDIIDKLYIEIFLKSHIHPKKSKPSINI